MRPAQGVGESVLEWVARYKAGAGVTETLGLGRVATLFGGMWKKTLGIDGLLACTSIAYFIAGIALIVGIKFLFLRDYQRVRE